MKKRTFSKKTDWASTGIAILRVITGLFLVYHGLEVFNGPKIHEYATWDSIKNIPYPLMMTYIGKGIEFVGGLFLAVGFLTRPACLAIAVTMLVICFKIGSGKFWYEDQYPFLFAILAMIYFCLGAGKYSIEDRLKKSL